MIIVSTCGVFIEADIANAAEDEVSNCNLIQLSQPGVRNYCCLYLTCVD